MWELAIQTATLVAVLAILGLGAYAFVGYIRLLRVITHAIESIKMDCDALINQLLAEEEDVCEKKDAGAEARKTEQREEPKRARLAAVVAGGMAKNYLGKQLTLAQVDEMTDDEVFKYHSRYEARLGASMVKTLGASALQMYALAAGTFLPIPHENQPQLVSDLDEDPFVKHALTTACCELYNRYGMYLAPLTAAMTTAKHCQFGDRETPANTTTEDGDDAIANDTDGGRACPSDPPNDREGDGCCDAT